MKQTLILLLLSVIVVLQSCTSVECYIDNPTRKEISVSIDGKSAIIVPPLRYKKVNNLSEGKHTMKVNNGKEVEFSTKGNSGFINPTLSTYVIVSIQYSLSGTVNNLPSNTIILDGTSFTGPFEKTAEAFICTDDFDYQINEPVRDAVEASSGTKTLQKIFRKTDFVKYTLPNK